MDFEQAKQAYLRSMDGKRKTWGSLQAQVVVDKGKADFFIKWIKSSTQCSNIFKQPMSNDISQPVFNAYNNSARVNLRMYIMK